jgi:hypothetical protein
LARAINGLLIKAGSAKVYKPTRLPGEIRLTWLTGGGIFDASQQKCCDAQKTVIYCDHKHMGAGNNHRQPEG